MRDTNTKSCETVVCGIAISKTQRGVKSQSRRNILFDRKISKIGAKSVDKSGVPDILRLPIAGRNVWPNKLAVIYYFGVAGHGVHKSRELVDVVYGSIGLLMVSQLEWCKNI